MKTVLCFGDSNTWGWVPGPDGGGRAACRARAVMSNDSKRALDPKVNLVFLDGLGIEMGRAEVGLGEGETLDGTRAMLPGEVRSFTSEIRVERGEEPAYFLVRPR